ncbi:MAG: phosphatidate cytidylyltransferase [Actinomycetota bacterium]
MVPEGDDRGGKFEDLFEDLDKFFAPGNQGGERRPREAGGAKDNEGRGAGSTEQGEAAAGSGISEGSEDLLPSGWEPDIEGLDLGVDPTAVTPQTARTAGAMGSQAASSGGGPSDEDAGENDEADERLWRRPDATKPEPPEEPAPAPEQPASDIWAAEPTGEMTGEDWGRLRDVLGEEKQAEDFEYPAEPSGTPPQEDVFVSEEREGPTEAVGWESGVDSTEGQELTLEDLKKAPPEYRDLPASSEEAAEAAATGPGEGEAAKVGVPETPSPREPYWDEPGISDAEAAADHLAAEYGEAEGPDAVEEDLLAGIEEQEGPRTVKVGGGETLTGPTWEEPTSQPLTAEQAPPEPGRNLPAAVLTAAVLVGVALISLAVSRAAFAVVAGAVVLLGQAELYATMHRRGHQPASALGLVIGGFTLAGAYLKGEQAMAFFVVLGLMLSFLWYMVAAPKAREGSVRNMASTMLGVLYVPFLAGYILIILAQSQSGRALMLAVLGLTFIYDIAAFLFGSFWGSRALAPTISPKKSWEGLFGATVVTFALAVAILPSIDPLTLGKSVGLAIVVALFAPLGDLAESAIKRDLGVKDMGSILPGHGGVLDRIDSVLFVAPAAFYFLRLVF